MRDKVWNFCFRKRWIIQIKWIISVKFKSYLWLLNARLLNSVLFLVFLHFFNWVDKCSNHFFDMSKLSLFCFCLPKEIYNQILLYQVIDLIILFYFWYHRFSNEKFVSFNRGSFCTLCNYFLLLFLLLCLKSFDLWRLEFAATFLKFCFACFWSLDLSRGNRAFFWLVF